VDARRRAIRIRSDPLDKEISRPCGSESSSSYISLDEMLAICDIAISY
jgi:hypothetical protein